MPSDYVSRKSLVPVIRKSDFDNKATEFLSKYCPEALKQPMAVPIAEIARKKIGLRVITDYRLTEDFSILGQMCFTNGVVPVYDKAEDEFTDLLVKRGTMLIDPDTFFQRNIGSLNNTIAHECVHWVDHRYYFMSLPSSDTPVVACRCPTAEKNEENQSEWTDIDWIEWQANGIAPRILMPIQTFSSVVESIKKTINEQIPKGDQKDRDISSLWW